MKNVGNWLWEHRGGIAAFVAWLVTRTWFTEWAGAPVIDLMGYGALLLGSVSVAGGVVITGYNAYKKRNE